MVFASGADLGQGAAFLTASTLGGGAALALVLAVTPDSLRVSLSPDVR
jgi:hypothetical protein